MGRSGPAETRRHGEMLTMHRRQSATVFVVVMMAVSVALAGAETRKEFHFKVRRRANVSIINEYGPISVRSVSGKEVSVIAILHSDMVEIDESHTRNRVAVFSHLKPGADADSGRVDYEVLVPASSNVTLHSTTGPLRAEKLHGDLTLEGNTASVDVREVSDGHIHIKTLNGPVTLNNISDGHVEITSISGDVVLTSVNGPFVQVNSSSGKIKYDGDFGEGGEYSLTSHTGDIEATAPAYASIDVTARSERGKVENDFLLQPKHTYFVIKAGSAFAGTIGEAASSVKLFSISGKIHLK
jgi:DUF4097 and DUF4098 domain-containing protein YvlB